MKDAIGQQIREGWAALVEPGRGSVRAERVYVIGTKGNTKVRYLGNYWPGTTPQALNEYLADPEGYPEEKTILKINTRIIMLGVNDG